MNDRMQQTYPDEEAQMRKDAQARVEEFDYTITQNKLVLLAQFVNDLELEEFLRRIDRCETVAPLLDPTLYRAGALKLQDVRRLAEAAYGFQQEVHRQIAGRNR